MTRRPITNMAASVKARLLRRAKERGEDFNFVLRRYAQDRLLFRLTRSAHRDAFVLKGAILFAVWVDAPHRATKDVDLLGSGTPVPERILAVFREIGAVTLEPQDGLVWDLEAFHAERIRAAERYEAVRVHLEARLGNARISVQVDVGFGDAVEPRPAAVVLPPLLRDQPAVEISAYPREVAIAEKLHAMVDLGIGNSRMKDFYDIWYLSQEFEFDETALRDAVLATFGRRGTAVPTALPLALTDTFWSNPAKQAQWTGFVKRGVSRPEALDVVCQRLAEFIGSVFERGSALGRVWRPARGWEPR